MQAGTALQLASHQADLDRVADNKEDKVQPNQDLCSAAKVDIPTQNVEGDGLKPLPFAAALAPALASARNGWAHFAGPAQDAATKLGHI